MPYKYEVLTLIEDTPENIFDLEVELHRIFKEYKYKPRKEFPGYTECFTKELLNTKNYEKIKERNVCWGIL